MPHIITQTPVIKKGIVTSYPKVTQIYGVKQIIGYLPLNSTKKG